MSNLLSIRSVVASVVFSLPLVACASFDGVVPAGVSAGGGSGGSPLAGSPTFSTEGSVATNRAPLARDVTVAHDSSPRSELRIHEVLTCRQCR